MKRFKWLELICTGKRSGLITVIFGFLLSVSTVLSQDVSISIPFGEKSKYNLAQIRLVEKNIFFFEPMNRSERKSPSRAFFSSLILPGTGESYVGNETQGKIFFGIEIVGWGLVIANIINVTMRQNDYQNYAVQHGVLDRVGKDDQFWIDIGKYDSIFMYNEQRLRERDLEALYPENHFWFWQWDNPANRFLYDSKRIKTRDIEQNRLYFFAVIALNHLVSAVNALRLANAYNRQLDELSLKFNINYNPVHNRFLFSLQKSF